MTPDDAKSLWAEVKANNSKLEGCPRHLFSGTIVRLGEKKICLNCGGSIGLVDIGNYIKGYEAAGQSSDDIWPEYRMKRCLTPT